MRFCVMPHFELTLTDCFCNVLTHKYEVADPDVCPFTKAREFIVNNFEFMQQRASLEIVDADGSRSLWLTEEELLHPYQEQ